MANALNDTRRISHGTPYDVRNRADVWQGMKDAYINAIQAAPEWLVGQMAPEQYNRGVIASTPKDRIRSAQMHREQNIAQRRQDIGRDYEQGMDYGTALGFIADPYIDGPLAGIAKLAKVGQATRAQAKPFNALSDLAGERGAIDLPSGGIAMQTYRGTPPEGALVGGKETGWTPPHDVTEYGEVHARGAYLDTHKPTAESRKMQWELGGDKTSTREYDYKPGTTLDVTSKDGSVKIKRLQKEAQKESKETGGDFQDILTEKLKKDYRYVRGGGYLGEEGELISLFPEDDLIKR